MARPKSDIKARIVHAARERFLVDGVDGASLRRIARGAKTSIGMIYYYFPTKDDLFLGVVEELYVGVLADMEKALAPDASVHERIRRFYVRIGALSELELTTVKLVVREVLVSSSRFERLIERFQRGHLPLVFATLFEGRNTGVFDPELHPALPFMAMLALGTLPQFMRRMGANNIPLPDVPSGEDLSNRLVHVLFNGIGNPDAKERS